MTKFTNAIIAAVLAVAIATPIVPAFAGQIPASVTPAGKWEVDSGEARYDVKFCGDGTQLCATLTWLRDDVRTPENLAYLNKLVVQGAVKAGPVKWVGDVVYEGQTYNGAVTMLGTNTMKMAGCVGIACNTMVFNRI